MTSTEHWPQYFNSEYGLLIKYPRHLKVEELYHIQPKASPYYSALTIKFFSSEAAPDAIIPTEKLEFNEFSKHFFFAYILAYDNPGNLPLPNVLQEIYADKSIDGKRSIFEILQPGLKSSRVAYTDALPFVGVVSENPQKTLFLSRHNQVLEFTLYGGPESGTNYSDLAEIIFDLMIENVKFN